MHCLVVRPMLDCFSFGAILDYFSSCCPCSSIIRVVTVICLKSRSEMPFIYFTNVGASPVRILQICSPYQVNVHAGYHSKLQYPFPAFNWHVAMGWLKVNKSRRKKCPLPHRLTLLSPASQPLLLHLRGNLCNVFTVVQRTWRFGPILGVSAVA